MPSSKLCDGSVVEYEPIFEDTSCDECGHRTGTRVINEPKFHAPTVKRGDAFFCPRCNDEFVGLEKATAILVETLVPAVKRQLEAVSPFYEYLKR